MNLKKKLKKLMKTSDIEVIAIGELLIDMIADNPGMKMEFQTSFTRYPGGAPANFAVNVRRLGINSGVITKIGDDFFGRFLIDTLNSPQGYKSSDLNRH